jgi:phosphoglycolate phosphatase
MDVLRIAGRRVECEMAAFDMTGTLMDVKARTSSRARMRAKTLEELAGEEAVGHWARLSGVDTETWEVDGDGPLAKAPRREDLIVGATALYLTGYGWQEAKELVVKVYDEADRKLPAFYKPSLFNGAEDALKRLKEAGLKLSIATNDRRTDAEESFRVAGVLHLFDAVVGADEVKNPKPSPEMIQLACERCGSEPENTLYFGDQPTDMLAGRAAGVKAVIAVCYGSEPSPEISGLADVVVSSFDEIEAL